MILGDTYLDEVELQSAGFAEIGQNVKVHKRASIYCPENISLSDNVRIDDFSVVIATGKVTLGRHVHIPNFCFLGGTFGIEIEDYCTLAPGVMIFSASDDYSGARMTNPTIPKHLTGGKSGKVVLRKYVIIGAGSIILPACVVGVGCAIGALSLVKNDLEEWGVYAGVPARRLKARKKDLLTLEADWNE